MDRRELLDSAVFVGAASMLRVDPARADDQSVSIVKMIDTNVSLFQWPFRRLPLDETDALIGKLRSLGITQAWAGSFEGLLHRDVAAVNQRLAESCSPHPELVPIGEINLALPAWEEDFRRCVQHHKTPGVRVHPNYHGYTLADPRFAKLLQLATKAKRFVQVAAAMEDVRTQHPLMQVRDVDLSPLPDALRRCPGARVQTLNYRPRSGDALLEQTPGVYFDTARVEGTDGVARLLRSPVGKRIMLGTHAPFLVPEAALIRTRESRLTTDELSSLLWQNAERMLK